MLEINLLAHRETHARTLVNDQLATQVGLLFVALHEKFLGSAIQFPVDMPDWLTRVVKAVFGKLNGESMERTFVKARDEAFDNLPRQKLETAELGQAVPIDGKVRHDIKFYLSRIRELEKEITCY